MATIVLLLGPILESSIVPNLHCLIFFPPFLKFYFIFMPFCVLLGRVALLGDVESKVTCCVS